MDLTALQHEDEILRLLPVGAALDESIYWACGHFDRILGRVFEALSGKYVWRY